MERGRRRNADVHATYSEVLLVEVTALRSQLYDHSLTTQPEAELPWIGEVCQHFVSIGDTISETGTILWKAGGPAGRERCSAWGGLERIWKKKIWKKGIRNREGRGE
jgi:hypothetical protein